MVRSWGVVAAAALTVTVSACSGSVVTGTGSGSAVAASSTPTSFPSTSASSAAPTSATPVPPSPTPPASPTPVPAPTTTSPLNATRDITDIRYRKPTGFVYGSTYRLNNPGEQSFQARFLVPRGTQPGAVDPDVIALVLYRLPASVRVVTPQEQLARVKYYNRMSHATVQSGIHLGVIAGYPAIQENAIEQDSNATYRYAAWYLFGTRHIVLVSCQVNSKVAAIAHGCQALLDSIKLS